MPPLSVTTEMTKLLRSINNPLLWDAAVKYVVDMDPPDKSSSKSPDQPLNALFDQLQDIETVSLMINFGSLIRMLNYQYADKDRAEKLKNNIIE